MSNRGDQNPEPHNLQALLLFEEDLMAQKSACFRNQDGTKKPPTLDHTVAASAKTDDSASRNLDVAVLRYVSDEDISERKELARGAEEAKKEGAGSERPPMRTTSLQVSPRLSLPGAFHEQPTWSSPQLQDSDPSSRLDPENPTPQGSELPQTEPVAKPVAMPTEVAEPVDRSFQQRKQQAFQSRLLVKLSLALCLLLVVGVCLAVAIFLSRSKKDQQLIPVPREAPTPSLEGFWIWDLPFEAPESMLRAFDEDTNHSTPISEAFQWIKRDPVSDEYTEYQTLQRFVLAMFFHATNGAEWANTGDEVAKVIVNPLEAVNPYYKNRGEEQAMHDQKQDEALIFSTSELNQLQPGSADCGGDAIQGGVQEVLLSSQPWLSYSHSVCSWFSTAPLVNLTTCNSDRQLLALDLENNHIKGTLPEALALLTSLTVINLPRNELQGKLSEDLCSLSNLQNVHVGRNSLTGTIPACGSLWSKIWSLDLSVNQLTGPFPQELYALSRLEYLHAGDNQLSGPLHPDIGTLLPRLGSLVLRRNRMTGTLPTSLGMLKRLFRLAIFENQFSGTLPTELGTMSSLQWILAQNNLFTGTIPSEIGLLKLRVFKLSNMRGITGTIPPELRSLNETLKVLDLKGTSITGTIPEALCGLDCLSFDCSDTLCGCDCHCSERQ